MKLISIIKFVLEQEKEHYGPTKIGSQAQRYNNIFSYAKFLKQPLTLGMFVPVDEEGNVLEEPLQGYPGNEQYEGAEMDKYHQSKERVLFEGISKELAHMLISDWETIEDLTKSMFAPLNLTKTAIKQMGELTERRL